MSPNSFTTGFASPMKGSPYGMSNQGYGMGQPYAMGMYGGQGSYGQNDRGRYGQMVRQPIYPQEMKASAEDRYLGRLLTAGGVPNDDGRIRWPIGLKILAGTRSDELREQIAALFLVEAAESAPGPVNANVAKLLASDIQEFRQRLLKDKIERFRMPLRVYEEAEDFLAKLSTAEKFLQGGLGNPTELKSTGTGMGIR